MPETRTNHGAAIPTPGRAPLCSKAKGCSFTEGHTGPCFGPYRPKRPSLGEPAETTPTEELAEALEAFAMARHRISAREGTIVSKYREESLQLLAAHARIVRLFARRGSAHPVETGTTDGAYLPSPAAESDSRAPHPVDGDAPTPPLPFAGAYWKDAHPLAHRGAPPEELRKLSVELDQRDADARLGAALRKALDTVRQGSTAGTTHPEESSMSEETIALEEAAAEATSALHSVTTRRAPFCPSCGAVAMSHTEYREDAPVGWPIMRPALVKLSWTCACGFAVTVEGRPATADGGAS